MASYNLCSWKGVYTAENDGGIYAIINIGDSDLIIICDNTATDRGGGAYLYQSDCTLGVVNLVRS